MSYAAKVLADSIGPSGKRLTTIELTYQRFVHAELMTHRLLSRNSASSRAIPVAKMLAAIAEDPAMPVWWGKNQAGMEAAEELVDDLREDARLDDLAQPRSAAQRLWLEARDSALMYAQRLAEVGLHKQIANRVTEPWMWITVIVSATEWSNVWGLRLTPHAQPEMRHAWQLAHDAIAASTPEPLPEGAWHMPLIRPADVLECCALADKDIREGIDPAGILDPRWLVDAMLRKLSVARCARVSYLTHDGRRDLAEDFKLHDRLASNGHWSPFEHVARALDDPRRVGNFIGWHQYRKDFQNEHIGSVMP